MSDQMPSESRSNETNAASAQPTSSDAISSRKRPHIGPMTVRHFPPPEHTSVPLLFRALRSTQQGLTSREAARRLVAYGPNELRQRGNRTWPKDLVLQFVHPLALLLWTAAALALFAHTAVIAIAIIVVILLNAVFAFWQEQQAEHAVEALACYLPHRATVVRDGRRQGIAVRELVPGDVLLIEEGDAILKREMRLVLMPDSSMGPWKWICPCLLANRRQSNVGQEFLRMKGIFLCSQIWCSLERFARAVRHMLSSIGRE